MEVATGTNGIPAKARNPCPRRIIIATEVADRNSAASRIHPTIGSTWRSG